MSRCSPQHWYVIMMAAHQQCMLTVICKRLQGLQSETPVTRAVSQDQVATLISSQAEKNQSVQVFQL